jgi:hypothetical protein
MKETMGDRIRMHRARLHLSQTTLAGRIGISLTSMSAIERTHRPACLTDSETGRGARGQCGLSVKRRERGTRGRGPRPELAHV